MDPKSLTYLRSTYPHQISIAFIRFSLNPTQKSDIIFGCSPMEAQSSFVVNFLKTYFPPFSFKERERKVFSRQTGFKKGLDKARGQIKVQLILLTANIVPADWKQVHNFTLLIITVTLQALYSQKLCCFFSTGTNYKI